MKFFLLHLKLNGIKNISHEIQLDFYNKGITNFDPDMFRVKAIYGENGSGKTAIVTAISIAKKIILNPGYLKQVETQSFLREIVNKKIQRLDMEFEFAEYDDKNLSAFRYTISVTRNSMDVYELSRERLETIRQYTKNKKYKTVFDVVQGEIKEFNSSQAVRSQIKERTMNTLLESTLAYKMISSLEWKETVFQDVVSLVMFFFSINIHIDEEDMHEVYLINRILDNLQKNSDNKITNEMYSMIDKQLFYIDSKGHDIVAKNDFAKYKKKVERLQRFIQIFKKDLQAISIDRRDKDAETYSCELVMDYGDYTVNREFESTGIKKLIRIYDALVSADEGKIAFVDEMDSNLNDVYLCKIVEYFMNYGKGQLCFTAHNVDPMAILKNNKNSIDFLSSDNRVVSWKITGNASPDRFYRNGMIENSPFNVDAIDFIGMFGE